MTTIKVIRIKWTGSFNPEEFFEKPLQKIVEDYERQFGKLVSISSLFTSNVDSYSTFVAVFRD